MKNIAYLLDRIGIMGIVLCLSPFIVTALIDAVFHGEFFKELATLRHIIKRPFWEQFQ